MGGRRHPPALSCERTHHSGSAVAATSLIGHETAPNRLSRLLPHRGFDLGTQGRKLESGSRCDLISSITLVRTY
jgi:hypothetical protein